MDSGIPFVNFHTLGVGCYIQVNQSGHDLESFGRLIARIIALAGDGNKGGAHVGVIRVGYLIVLALGQGDGLAAAVGVLDHHGRYDLFAGVGLIGDGQDGDFAVKGLRGITAVRGPDGECHRFGIGIVALLVMITLPLPASILFL